MAYNVGRIGEEAVFNAQSSANAQQPIKDKQFIIYSSAAFLPIRCYGQGGYKKRTMYNKVECICLTCDNCGETFVDEHSGFSIYADENGAHEAADNDGWHSEDGKHYCPECHTIDDEDNLILKKLPPIYEVIADFPDNKDFPKGKKIEFQPWSGSDLYWSHVVEDCQGKREWLVDYFDNYPHLFRKVR